VAKPVTMAVSFEEMSLAERVLHVQDLWDRIAAEPEAMPLTNAQRDELRRRVVSADADPDGAIPWEIAREQIRQRR